MFACLCVCLCVHVISLVMQAHSDVRGSFCSSRCIQTILSSGIIREIRIRFHKSYVLRQATLACSRRVSRRFGCSGRSGGELSFFMRMYEVYVMCVVYVMYIMYAI